LNGNRILTGGIAGGGIKFHIDVHVTVSSPLRAVSNL
jgi:hypothetical protein